MNWLPFTPAWLVLIVSVLAMPFMPSSMWMVLPAMSPILFLGLVQPGTNRVEFYGLFGELVAS